MEKIKSKIKETDKTREEFLEQVFKITKTDSFQDLKEEACKFWQIDDDKNDFTLVLPNKHDIMSLNEEQSHVAHTVSKFFEINRSKRAVLHLIKPDKNRRSIYQDERPLIKIFGAEKTSRFEGGDKQSKEDHIAERERKNLKSFFATYPDLEHELIVDQEQFQTKRRNKMNIENPDMSFCSFMLSFGMFCLSLYTFYSHRDFNNEYFNR